MKNLYIFALITVLISSCNSNNQKNNANVENDSTPEEIALASFGEDFSVDASLTAAEMNERFKSLKVGDTIEVTFSGNVNQVCKNKGCWMKMDLPDAEEDVMVKFKDYGFFVPKDIDNKEAVVHGKAYVAEVSIDEQRHFAEDEGKSKEEIEAINQPKRTLSFLADGVVIKE